MCSNVLQYCVKHSNCTVLAEDKKALELISRTILAQLVSRFRLFCVNASFLGQVPRRVGDTDCCCSGVLRSFWFIFCIVLLAVLIVWLESECKEKKIVLQQQQQKARFEQQHASISSEIIAQTHRTPTPNFAGCSRSQSRDQRQNTKVNSENSFNKKWSKHFLGWY